MVSVLASLRWKLIARIAATDAKVEVDDLNTWRILDSSLLLPRRGHIRWFHSGAVPVLLGCVSKGGRSSL